MASAEAVNKIKERLAALGAVKVDQFISRPAWGEITFDIARPSVETILGIAADLTLMPLELLDDGVLNNIETHLTRALEALNQIGTFSLTQGGNPTDVRNSLSNAVRDRANELVNVSYTWIAYLGYKQGDVQKGIAELTNAISVARKQVDDAVATSTLKLGEIDKIVVAAREASANAGVAHFTGDFATEAGRLDTLSVVWLKATAALVVVAVTVAVGSFWHAIFVEPKSQFQFIQFGLAKLLFFIVVLSAAVWCGRMYKALSHQATVNRHRANSIKTFQAFNAAASDDQTRNAVLMETTRAIFANVPSGLLDTNSDQSDGSTRVLELLRIGGKSST